MRILPLLALAAVAIAAPALAAKPAAAPIELGAFGKWVAATHGVGGGRICYAFTRTNGQDPITGSGPTFSSSHGIRCSRITGISTKKPHMP